MVTGASFEVGVPTRETVSRFWRQAPASFRIGAVVLLIHLAVACVTNRARLSVRP